MIVRYLQTVLLICLLALAGACGSDGISDSGTGQPQIDNAEGPSPGGQAVVVRDLSGLPSGIRLSWDPVPDGVDEDIIGYHIYRSDAPIEDSSRGDDSLWLVDPAEFIADGNGNDTIFPTSLLPFGEQFDYLDLKSANLPLAFGETWYYRISALNDSGDEGLLSEEVVLTITQHGVNDLSTYAAFVGEQLIVEGVRFGVYDSDIDRVTFVGRKWNADLVPPAFEDADIDAPILAWNGEQILVEVPHGATRGRVRVWIDETPAFPLQVFVCSSPYITDIAPYDRFTNQSFTISGGNFGPAFGPDNVIVMDDVEVTEPTSYPIWGNTQITFFAPPGTGFGQHSLQLRNGTELTDIGFINLVNRAPVAQFSMNTNSGAVPLAVNFNAGPSSDPDDGIAEWKFEFGDGTEETRTDGSNLIFSHIFDTVGVKSVTLTVTDFAGATDAITKNVTVTPAADILFIGDQFNGAGPGNEFTANLVALLSDLDAIGASYVVGGYSVGISQVAVDQGFKVVIWNRGGPGPGDPIQNWPRNWDADEKADFLALQNFGIPTLLISQNHQFTADFVGPNEFIAKYGQELQNDTVTESGSTRDFTWATGVATDHVYTDAAGFAFPSSPVCLLSTNPLPPLVTISPVCAERYSGPGASGQRPNGARLGTRIQSAMMVDPTTQNTGGATHPNVIPGMAYPGDDSFRLCYSYGIDVAPDANIGFSGTGYSHSDGPGKLWVVGWSYSEAVFTPDGVTRSAVLQNILAWLDSSLF